MEGDAFFLGPYEHGQDGGENEGEEKGGQGEKDTIVVTGEKPRTQSPGRAPFRSLFKHLHCITEAMNALYVIKTLGLGRG